MAGRHHRAPARPDAARGRHADRPHPRRWRQARQELHGEADRQDGRLPRRRPSSPAKARTPTRSTTASRSTAAPRRTRSSRSRSAPRRLVPVSPARARGLALALGAGRRRPSPTCAGGREPAHRHRSEGGRMKKLFVLRRHRRRRARARRRRPGRLHGRPSGSARCRSRGLRRASRGWSRSACSSTAARRCPTRSRRSGSATPPASCSRFKAQADRDRRLVPRPGRVPEGRPLLARRLRRLPVRGVRECAHLQVRPDRRGV